MGAPECSRRAKYEPANGFEASSAPLSFEVSRASARRPPTPNGRTNSQRICNCATAPPATSRLASKGARQMRTARVISNPPFPVAMPRIRARARLRSFSPKVAGAQGCHLQLAFARSARQLGRAQQTAASSNCAAPSDCWHTAAAASQPPGPPAGLNISSCYLSRSHSRPASAATRRPAWRRARTPKGLSDRPRNSALAFAPAAKVSRGRQLGAKLVVLCSRSPASFRTKRATHSRAAKLASAGLCDSAARLFQLNVQVFLGHHSSHSVGATERRLCQSLSAPEVAHARLVRQSRFPRAVRRGR